MSPEERKMATEITPTKTASRFGPGLTAEGQLTGHEDLELQGTFNGQIELAVHDLIVQKTAKVKADVKAKNLFLYGQLEGKVKAERVVISETGRFAGEILACKISIQNGAKFKGSIKISKDYQP